MKKCLFFIILISLCSSLTAQDNTNPSSISSEKNNQTQSTNTSPSTDDENVGSGSGDDIETNEGTNEGDPAFDKDPEA